MTQPHAHHRRSRRQPFRQSRDGAGPGRRRRGCRRRHREIPDLQRQFAGRARGAQRPIISNAPRTRRKASSPCCSGWNCRNRRITPLIARAKTARNRIPVDAVRSAVARIPAVARPAAHQDRLRRPDQCAVAACGRQGRRDADPVDRHGDAGRSRGSAGRAGPWLWRQQRCARHCRVPRGVARSGGAAASCTARSACFTARPNIPARPRT